MVKPDARAPFYGSFSYLFLVGSFSVSEDFFSHLGLSHSVVLIVSWCRSTAPSVLYPNLPFFYHTFERGYSLFRVNRNQADLRLL